MGEVIKPDYSLSFKRYWFAKIWNGEKDVEYRACVPKYKRLTGWVGDNRPRFMMFYIGMQPTGPRLLVEVIKIEIGPCPIEGFDGDHYCIHFNIIQHYMFDHGTYFPMMEVPKMKPKKGTKK